MIAVIGCGYWGKNLVRNFAALGVLTGICDVDVNQAKIIAEQNNTQVLSWEAVLKDSAILGVAIASPAVLHAKLAEEALLADKHVFVEKPLALTVLEAEHICAIAKQKNKHLMVGHLLQYHPAFCTLKEMVQQGRLGRLQYIYSNRLNLGKIRCEEDILWSFAPHDISMILSLVGSEPDKITTIGGYYLHKTIADVTTTHLSFPGGQQAHVFVSWLHPFKEQKLIVVGDRAMAVFDDGEPRERKLQFFDHKIEWREGMPLPTKAEAEYISISSVEPLLAECQHFVDCINMNLTPKTDGQEGLRVLRVLEKSSQNLKCTADTLPSQTALLQSDFSVHESAYVDENVEIGKGTKIWHFSHILPRTKIGQNVVIGQNVAIGPDVRVGNDCKIQNNVSLYKGVILEDGVFCGPSCVFTNVNTPRAEVNRHSEFLTTCVERGATIGANATIVCGHTIGAYSFIAAGAVVTSNVRRHALMMGVPARQVGWMSHSGEKLGPDLICPRTGQSYKVNELNELEEIQLIRNVEVWNG
jgi:UDP-2-acetamido-3-amino-2,3-dideoxy-glucuronate N-acetyltransferase